MTTDQIKLAAPGTDISERFPALDGFIGCDEWCVIVEPIDGSPATIIGNGDETSARGEFAWRRAAPVRACATYLIASQTIIDVIQPLGVV